MQGELATNRVHPLGHTAGQMSVIGLLTLVLNMHSYAVYIGVAEPRPLPPHAEMALAQ